MKSQSLLGLFTALLLMALPAASTWAAAPPVEGREYTRLDPAQPPLDSDSKGQVEVVEFFYYGCPHCFTLQPALDRWVKTLPKDVAFRRMPTVFRQSWIPLTQTYYALEAIGELERVHEKVFEAVHRQNANLGDRRVLLDWASKNGIDAKKLGAALDSFAVKSKTQRSIQLTRAYGISGTPSVVVAGKYLTSPGMTLTAGNAVDYGRFMEVLEGLIAMARTSGNGAKP